MVLVTGATGLLGSALTRLLLARGLHVRIFRRETSSLDLLDGFTDSVQQFTGDIDDPLALAEAMAGVEDVYHAAAYIGFGGHRERQRLFRV
ncbi:MAG: NAD-dependent epimerase/dehydratase family protein, partial [Rhodothermales bacterium]